MLSYLQKQRCTNWSITKHNREGEDHIIAYIYIGISECVLVEIKVGAR